MEYTVRQATKEDMPGVLALIKQLAEYEKEPDAVIISVQDLEENGFGKNQIFNCYIAEAEGKIRGISLFYFRFSTWKGKTVHLEDIVIEKAYRGYGMGTTLFKKTLEFAAKHKVKRIEWVVLDWNTPAVNFYKKAGATVFEKWNTVQIEEDAYLKYLGVGGR